MYCNTKSTQELMKIDAIKIPIFKQNNFLCIVTQKVPKNEGKVYPVCHSQKKSSHKRKVRANLEKDVCILKSKIN